MLHALDQLPNAAAEGLPGIYLDVIGRPSEPLKRDSLDASGLTLLRFEDAGASETNQERATVFATPQGIERLRAKVEQFRTEDTAPREKDGEIIPGRPKNADLVQGVAAITEAGLRALWRSPESKLPGEGEASWEIWLDPGAVAPFTNGAPGLGVQIGSDRLEFPEDTVVIAMGTRDAIALAVRRLGGVRALAAVSVTADSFDGLPVAEQAVWVEELVKRTNYPSVVNVGYVTVLDTGVSRAHPLIEPLLAVDDRHAANVAWGLEDVKGHGTQLAGLALYGDLTPKLYQANPVDVGHRLGDDRSRVDVDLFGPGWVLEKPCRERLPLDDLVFFQIARSAWGAAPGQVGRACAEPEFDGRQRARHQCRIRQRPDADDDVSAFCQKINATVVEIEMHLDVRIVQQEAG